MDSESILFSVIPSSTTTPTYSLHVHRIFCWHAYLKTWIMVMLTVCRHNAILP